MHMHLPGVPGKDAGAEPHGSEDFAVQAAVDSLREGQPQDHGVTSGLAGLWQTHTTCFMEESCFSCLFRSNESHACVCGLQDEWTNGQDAVPISFFRSAKWLAQPNYRQTRMKGSDVCMTHDEQYYFFRRACLKHFSRKPFEFRFFPVKSLSRKRTL